MLKSLKRWYYRRLFLRIYFAYLRYGNNPNDAINDAFNDMEAIKTAREKILL